MTRYVTGILLALALVGCTPAEKGIFDYTEEEVIGLTTQWVNAAIAGQQFAKDAHCDEQAQDFDLEELIDVDAETMQYLDVWATRKEDHWLVEYHVDWEREDGIPADQSVIFVMSKDFESRWGDGAASKEYPEDWCAFVPL